MVLFGTTLWRAVGCAATPAILRRLAPPASVAANHKPIARAIRRERKTAANSRTMIKPILNVLIEAMLPAEMTP